MHQRITRFLGMDTSQDSLLVPGGAAERAVNVCVKDGNLCPASTHRLWDVQPPDGEIGSLHAYYRRDGAGNSGGILIAGNENGYFALEGGSWRCILQMPGSRISDSVNYQIGDTDGIILSDPVRGAYYFTGGESATQLTGCPGRFSSMALHYERVWGGGNPARPDSVYWSRSFDALDWSGDSENPDAAGGELVLPTWDGGSIAAVRALYDDIAVFKDGGIFRITGTYPGEYEVVRVSGRTERIAPGTIVSDGAVCYFLGGGGIYGFSGASVRILDDLRADAFWARLNAAALDKACARIRGGVMYVACAVDGSDENNAVLEIDLVRGTYIERTDTQVCAMAEWDGRLVFADASGRIWEYGGGGRTACARWESGEMDLRNQSARKNFRMLDIALTGEVNLVLQVDGKRKVRRLRGDGRGQTIPVGMRGRMMRIAFESTGADFCVRPGMVITYET